MSGSLLNKHSIENTIENMKEYIININSLLKIKYLLIARKLKD